MITTAVILAGGGGTRLKPFTEDNPKPMVLVAGRPLLYWVVQWLKKHGIKKIVLGVAWKKEKIIDYFRENGNFGCEVHFSEHTMEGGTAQGFRLAIERFVKTEENFVAMNGDELTSLDLHNMMNLHEEKIPAVTMAVTPFYCKFSVVRVGDEGQVCGFTYGQKVPEAPVSIGIYVFNRKILPLIPQTGSIEDAVFKKLAESGEGIVAYPLREVEDWASVNTHKDITEAEAKLKEWAGGRLPMRILFIHKESGYRFGGVEYHIRELAKRLSQRGHQITILAEEGNPNPLAELEKMPGIRCVYLGKAPVEEDVTQKKIKGALLAQAKKNYQIARLGKLATNHAWYLKCFNWVNGHKEQFDVASVHKFVDLEVLKAVNKMSKLPYVMWLEGYETVEATSAKNAPAVIAISKFIQEECMKNQGFSPMLMPIGVDIAHFQNVDAHEVQEIRSKYTKPGDVLVVNVSRLVDDKDIPTMIRAAALLKDKLHNVKYVVCGDGPQKPVLEQMIKENGLTDRFFLVGAFGKELPKYYQAADVVLHVAKVVNHFGVVYIEAMAAGKPIIAADAEATPGTVGDAALLVHTQNPEEMSKAIYRLATEPELRKKLAANAIKRARDVFDWNKVIIDTEKIYTSAPELQGVKN
ncbi:MAG TPA: glycosyltransferase [Candidatus Norongarragalinales archaeon]|jgi:glycosyltransferase involved in cell wall biosynthesis/choline kinase|nr:glycosyltransferase [Candidatus Norongarragalinales archaeon]